MGIQIISCISPETWCQVYADSSFVCISNFTIFHIGVAISRENETSDVTYALTDCKDDFSVNSEGSDPCCKYTSE